MVAEEGLDPRHADYDSAANQLSYSATLRRTHGRRTPSGGAAYRCGALVGQREEPLGAVLSFKRQQ